jgi:hypothetical protein
MRLNSPIVVLSLSALLGFALSPGHPAAKAQDLHCLPTPEPDFACGDHYQWSCTEFEQQYLQCVCWPTSACSLQARPNPLVLRFKSDGNKCLHREQTTCVRWFECLEAISSSSGGRCEGDEDCETTDDYVASDFTDHWTKSGDC